MTQYFLRTADAVVERYLKLFTFLPLDSIALLMARQAQDPSKRLAQHILAREIVELAHGAAAAQQAITAHKDAFGQGAHTFSLLSLRNSIAEHKGTVVAAKEGMGKMDKELFEYKKAYAASSTTQSVSDTTSEQQKNVNENIVTLPLSMLQPGSFPQILHAAGLASSKSEANRMIANNGAYVVVPNSGPSENPTALKWSRIKPGKDVDPNHYLVDWEALVLRSGKTKIQICRVVRDDKLEKQAEETEQQES